MTEKTHWRKNIDSNYISGEDLKFSLNGLAPEINVTVGKFADAKAYDNNAHKDTVKSALYLKRYPSGEFLYKPALLNATNARFFEGLTGSPYLDDWLEKPVTIYAMPDPRHGQVVRFKSYIAPPAIKSDAALAKMNKASDLAKLGKIWEGLSPAEKKLADVMALKEKLKIQFTSGAAE